MKNIHILPTDEPSRLVKQKYDIIDRLCLADMATKRAEYKRFNIYITSDEEIKKDEYYLGEDNNIYCLVTTVNFNGKKIILTTDQDLIKDGVQAIDDKFLEWFVKNPSCEEVEVQKWFDGVYFTEYKITIPKEELEQDALNHFLSTSSVIVKDPQISNFNKQETLEEAAENHQKNTTGIALPKHTFIEGAKWNQERSYSEEEFKTVLNKLRHDIFIKGDIDIEKWFEQFKKK